jgi:hypothetical protein
MRFWEAVKAQVCLIVARQANSAWWLAAQGLGGARSRPHVPASIEGLQPGDDVVNHGNRIEIYFDFHYGEPLENFEPTLPGVRQVGLDPHWARRKCQPHRSDGVVDVLIGRSK